MNTAGKLSPEITFLIDFNLHWVPSLLGLDIPPPAAAAILGISEAELAAYSAAAETQVYRTADRLLAKPEVIQAIDAWSIGPRGKVLMVGDSITTYRYGYARLLAAIATLRRPDDGIQFINVAQSGYTSTHGLEDTYTQFLVHQPDWVFIKFGVNDCKHFGGPQSKTLVSLEEYQSNMAAIVKAFLNHTSAQLVLLTPTPVIEDIVTENPEFIASQMTWHNADLQIRAEVIRNLADQYGLPWVDLLNLFGNRPAPDLYLPDGLHPGPDGHHLILEAVLTALT